MNRKTLDQILSMSMSERKKKGLKIFDWEHGCKSFQAIPKEIVGENLIEAAKLKNGEKRTILKCEYRSNVYYFGVGAYTERLTLNMLVKGKWSIYTWNY